jgi:hypothetical protein
MMAAEKATRMPVMKASKYRRGLGLTISCCLL